jgi:hypothetical protein
MATIEGLTKARMLEIEAASVVEGSVDPATGHLILTTHDGATQDAGLVVGKDATALLTVGDTATVDLDLTGLGTPASPWLLKANVKSLPVVDMVANTDVDTLVTPGLYMSNTQATMNTIFNWPVEAIPRADKADANNTAGSYRDATKGLLEVQVAGPWVYQTVELYVPITSAGYFPGGDFSVTYKRRRSSNGTTWSPWQFQGPRLGARGNTDRDKIGEYLLRGNLSQRARTAMSVMISGSGAASPQAPFEVFTIDGVQWYSDNGVGRVSSGWKQLTWGSSITNYTAGPGWSSPQALRTSEGIIIVRGLGTRGTNLVNGDLITTLPEGMRPAGNLIFAGVSSNNTSGITMRVLKTGEVTMISNPSGSASFLDIGAIMFPAADVAPDSAWTPITLSPNWTAYAGYPAPSWWKDSFGRVWLRGLASGTSIPSADSEIFKLPAGLAPALQAHAAAPSSVANGGVSVHWVATVPASPSTSQMSYVYKVSNPTGTVTWVSLCQSYIFPVAEIPDSYWRTMLMANSWSTYGAAYPTQGIWTAPDGISHMRGLVKGGAGLPVAVTVPMAANDRPVSNLMWLTSSNNVMSRFTINSGAADHAVVANTGSTAWFSFDGGHYMTEG